MRQRGPRGPGRRAVLWRLRHRGAAAEDARRHHYRPKRRVPESLASPSYAQLAARRTTPSPRRRSRRSCHVAARRVGCGLCARAGRRGGGRTPVGAWLPGRAPRARGEGGRRHASRASEVHRARRPVAGPRRSIARPSRGSSRRCRGRLGGLRTAEFLITAIERRQGDALRAHGGALRPRRRRPGPGGRRASRPLADGMAAERGLPWRVRVAGPRGHVAAGPRRPSSPRSTELALGGNPSFRASARPRLWTTGSGASTPSSLPSGMGHHGVSAGDADGDGSDDLYVAQPAGLPDRLFRNRGDGTFEDVTEARRPARARQHVAVALRRRGQRRRPGPRAGDAQRASSSSRTTARDVSPRSTDAFRFQRPLRGSPTSVAMADYDRDGFLDVYLCTYSYFIGRARTRRGRPRPTTTRVNGPPERALPQRRARALRGRHRGGRPRPEQRPLQLRRRLGRLRRRRLARPARGQRLRAQEPLPQPGTRRTARSASGTWRRRRESRTTGRG